MPLRATPLTPVRLHPTFLPLIGRISKQLTYSTRVSSRAPRIDHVTPAPPKIERLLVAARATEFGSSFDPSRSLIIVVVVAFYGSLDSRRAGESIAASADRRNRTIPFPNDWKSRVSSSSLEEKERIDETRKRIILGAIMEDGARNDAPRSTKPEVGRTDVPDVAVVAGDETGISRKLSTRFADLAQVPLMQVSLRNAWYESAIRIYIGAARRGAARMCEARTSPLGPFAARQPAAEEAGEGERKGAERGWVDSATAESFNPLAGRRLWRRSTPRVARPAIDRSAIDSSHLRRFALRRKAESREMSTRVSLFFLPPRTRCYTVYLAAVLRIC